MSQSTAKGEVIGRFTIGFDDETKASIADLKTKLDAVPHRLNFGNVMPIGGLLAAVQDAAANDSNGVVHHGENVKPELKQMGQWVFEGQDAKWISAAKDADNDSNGVVHHGENVKPELKQMGQWVFEGQDAKWISAAKDADNEVWLFQVPVKDLAKNENDGYLLWYAQDGSKAIYLCDLRSNKAWQNSAIDRETVNDVDYLSSDLDEAVPPIDDAIDQSDWLSESVPQITQADMQLIFIKNLSDVLIQRMHSMGRFSEDDYHIGGISIEPWDLIVGKHRGKDCFAVVIATQLAEDINCSKVDVILLGKQLSNDRVGAYTNIYFNKDNTYRTITEAELPAFRAALEACYA